MAQVKSHEEKGAYAAGFAEDISAAFETGVTDEERDFLNTLLIATRRLAPGARAVLADHPAELVSALSAVAGVLDGQRASVSGSEVGFAESPIADLADMEEAARRLDAHTTPSGAIDVLTSDQVAERAGVKNRQTIHNWLKNGRIIGWEGAKRGYVFPAAQLDERGRPLSGLDLIAPHFADGYAAWIWLETPRNSLNGAAPLDLLRQGDVERVVQAAQGDALGDFA